MTEQPSRGIPGTHLHIIAHYHPWYRELFPSGMPSGNENIALERLPLLTARRLKPYHLNQTFGAGDELSRYYTSGTSSGQRKEIRYSWQDDEQYVRSKRQAFQKWLGGSLSGGRAMADLGTGHAASTAPAIFMGMGMEGRSIPFTAPIQEHIRQLADFRPQLLYTMPSLLESITGAAPDPSRLGIRKIILVGEIAPPEWQRNIAARFDLSQHDILDTYGSIEIGSIAAYDHELGLYVLAEGVEGECISWSDLQEMKRPEARDQTPLPQPDDLSDDMPDDLPADLPELEHSLADLADNEGVLVLTSLMREQFPAIRYVTYDVVRNFTTVEVNGQRRGVFSAIVKRIGSELKHGEKISLYDIEEVTSRLLKDAALRVMVEGNRLKIFLKSAELRRDGRKLALIQSELRDKIPAIGMMIRNGLLEDIEIIVLEEHEQLPGGAVKGKRIYS
ncbi:hypothetical protein M6D81_26415 [Paenibacillus sp. J5C_2022]|uniref:hypothetical protein n=1 Tax=Paenibacillus sp. J5C2022 TaxID=2977129 RepID=UPI0021D36D6B|nr:hypothetical protein [Paenibacillus sp. J5C2022]MCU6712240.1 hypothetical protein [Paenibacillus sp. J5C2022]